jgi:arylformamidase
MNLYDLSHLLNNNSPVYPGKESPRFNQAASIEHDGYRETHLEFDSHLGTHIDAPAHMLETGKTLDQMPLDSYAGNALIIPVPGDTRFIDKEFLLKFKDKIKDAGFVLFKTGWSKYWGTPAYFKDFPVLTLEAVNWLLGHSLKGIGFDAISADPVESTSWENHYAIFGKGAVIIENLVFPDNLTETAGRFTCFPIPYEYADGSTVRAVFETV